MPTQEKPVTSPRPAHDRTPDDGMPRWVKISGIIAIVLITLLIVLMLFGDHGPGRHQPSGGHASPTSSSGGTVLDHTPPTGGH